MRSIPVRGCVEVARVLGLSGRHAPIPRNLCQSFGDLPETGEIAFSIPAPVCNVGRMPRKVKSQWDFEADLFGGGQPTPSGTSKPSPPPIPIPKSRSDVAPRKSGKPPRPDTDGVSVPAPTPTVSVVQPEAVVPDSDGTAARAPAVDADPPDSSAVSVLPQEPWSVTELTRRVKGQLEDRFRQIRVRGEISNLRIQSSGHAYFVIKDSGAQLSCVLFRNQPGIHRTQLRDGVSVVLGGDITLYEPRGQYQLRVATLELEGEGALQMAFERLKRKLAAEGLFDSAHKQPLPRFPRRLGIVTSPTGAALRDVLHVLGRRFGGLEIVVAPARVQGTGAAEEIARGIVALNRLSGPAGVDVILVTRGGGSLEDLWAFNEEVVARAIAASDLPVVSAVGHEIDVTISDFVADVRAATPSAAAELLTANHVACRVQLTEFQQRLARQIRQATALCRSQLQEHERRLQRMHPRRSLERSAQQIDDALLRLLRSVRRGLREQGQRLTAIQQRLVRWRPRARLQTHRQDLTLLQARWQQLFRLRMAEKQRRLGSLVSALQLLSPLRVLERGYSITFDKQGRVIRRIQDVTDGDPVRTRVIDGEITSIVRSEENRE